MQPIDLQTAARLTVLIDNTAGDSRCMIEHGLSFLLETNGLKILIDTGMSASFMDNARVLDVDLDDLDAVVLSHGHYDHTGGLIALLDSVERKPAVYAHPDAFGPHYVVRGGSAAFIGMPQAATDLEQLGVKVIPTTGWTGIGDRVWITGQVARTTSYEDTGGPFFLDREGARPDPLHDDQAVVVELGEKLWIISGCAHSGVINILNKTTARFPNKKIDLLAGGFHLNSASIIRMDRTLDALEEFDVATIAAGHCTGPSAIGKIHERFGERAVALGSGTVFTA